jgi:predicted Rossmann-fold nucleotide-binding protein
MKSLCIDMGSKAGHGGPRAGFSIVLAKAAVYNDYRLAYGGTDVGLAGILADAMADSSGPREIIGVKGVHDRKRRALELADAFIDLPGGYGSIEEASAFLLRARRGHGRRPISFFTLRDYRDHIEALLDRAVLEGFIGPEDDSLIVSVKNAEAMRRMPEPIP